MGKALWVHLALALGVTAMAAPAAAGPAVGTISSFTGNIENVPNKPGGPGPNCKNPEGLTIDLAGNFYTASAATTETPGAICEFNHQGGFQKAISIQPGVPGGSVSLLGVLWQPPHTVFALDFADTLETKVPGTATYSGHNGRVIAVDTISEVVTTIATGFQFPNGFAEDLQGNLYVCDSFQGSITRMAQDGSNQTVWSSRRLLVGNPNAYYPIGVNGIEFDLLFQNMYASNTSNRQIIRIPVERGWTAGTAVVFADGPTIDNKQSTTNSLLGADGITFDLFGNLYVAANAANQIQVLSPSAQLVARYGATPGNPTPLIDVPASPVFLGDQLYFTNVSLYDGGLNSSVSALQTALPGIPPL
jgi:sugar lactone lactonase YvrE